MILDNIYEDLGECLILYVLSQYALMNGFAGNIEYVGSIETRLNMSEKNSNEPGIGAVLNEKDKNKQKEMYNKYVENMTPKSNGWLNCLKAFSVGGAICLIGEILNHVYMSFGNDKELAGMFTTLTLVGVSVILTGFNIYQKLGQFAGAGSIVPITGFANSVVSPAIEYQAEGDVFGVGCKIFTISGPVILYGIFSSFLLGVIYWIMSM